MPAEKHFPGRHRQIRIRLPVVCHKAWVLVAVWAVAAAEAWAAVVVWVVVAVRMAAAEEAWGVVAARAEAGVCAAIDPSS